MASKRINHHLKLIGIALLAYCVEAYKLDESLVGIPSKTHISFHAKGMYNGTLTHISLYIEILHIRISNNMSIHLNFTLQIIIP